MSCNSDVAKTELQPQLLGFWWFYSVHRRKFQGCNIKQIIHYPPYISTLYRMEQKSL